MCGPESEEGAFSKLTPTFIFYLQIQSSNPRILQSLLPIRRLVERKVFYYPEIAGEEEEDKESEKKWRSTLGMHTGEIQECHMQMQIGL